MVGGGAGGARPGTADGKGGGGGSSGGAGGAAVGPPSASSPPVVALTALQRLLARAWAWWIGVKRAASSWIQKFLEVGIYGTCAPSWQP